MAGFIIINDGRAVAPSNWGFDRMMEEIVKSLPNNENSADFKDWLLNQRNCICGPGLGSVDVRELTPENQELFWDAVIDAIHRCKAEGGEGWHDPNFYSSWMEMFSNLLAFRESYLDGEDPDAFNPYLKSVIPPTNNKSGPGW